MAEFHTDPGGRSVSQLERDVDHERERVSATIDELQSRASMGNIVDQLVRAVGENGGEVSRNLGRSLRDNPIAALLTGVGLAWLMAGSSRPSDREPGWEPEDARYRGGLDPDWQTFRASTESDTEPRVGSASGDGLGQRVADAAGKMGEGLSDTVTVLKDRAADLTHSAGSSKPGKELREEPGGRFAKQLADLPEEEAPGGGSGLSRDA